MKHLNIRVTGRVQGVFFRASTMDKALDFDLKGFVRNERDGSVYIEAEGDPRSLHEFVQWCYQGPTGAAVSGVSVDEGDWQGFASFEISR